MSEPEFDRYAKEYERLLDKSIPTSLSEDGYFAEYKVAVMSVRLRDRRPTRILDFGCGAGRSLPYLKKYFPSAELWGYDLSTASLEIASSRESGARLFSDWATVGDVRFDAVMAANVFHHIPREARPAALCQCRDVLSAEGQVFLFEHNPLNPVTRRIFERCPFDADAEMLGMNAAVELARMVGLKPLRHGYTLFFPKPLAFLRRLEVMLERIPVGAQYYVQMAR